MVNFSNSQKLFEKAKKLTPVGSQTYSKSSRYLATNGPYFMERGLGSHIWDVDGNEFVDFVLGLGPITIGYNDFEVNEAIVNQLYKGIDFSQATTLEIELAEKLIEIIPCAEMVKFLKNGSDATSAAIRLARAATGRNVIACCGYHGMDDWFIGTTKMNAGIPLSVKEMTETFIYNDINSLKNIFNKCLVAAVIMEPIREDGPAWGFLEDVKRLCEKNGTVLIFDEMVSGFRYALGGAQEFYGITPDLACFGKGIANGMPLSVVCGRKELMKQIEKDVFVSTTFGGEALSLAAAIKTIEILQRKESYDKIWYLSSKLLQNIQRLIYQKGLENDIKTVGLAPHSGVEFKDKKMLSVYQQRLTKEGILSLGINNFCLAHTESDIAKHIEAAEAAFNDINKGIVAEKQVDAVFDRNRTAWGKHGQ